MGERGGIRLPVDEWTEKRLMQWLVTAEPGARTEMLQQLDGGWLTTAFAQAVHGGILEVQQPGERVDVIELARWLADGGHTPIASASELLADADGGFIPVTALGHLRELHLRRRLQAVCLSGLEPTKDAATVAMEMRAVLEDLDLTQQSRFASLAEVMPDAMKRIENAGMDQIETGLASFDRFVGGLTRGCFTVIGARTSVGKTSVSLRFLRGIAENGVAGAIVSTEMRKARLMLRLISDAASVENWDLQQGRIRGEQEFMRVSQAFRRLSSLPIYVCDRSPTWPQLVADITELKNREPRLGVVIIDYVQMLRGIPGPRDQRRQQELARVTGDMVRLSKDLNIAAVAVAQLSRKTEEGKKSRRPTLSDFRECVTGDTSVVDATSGLLKFICDVKPGDKLLGVNAAQKTTIGTVTKSWATGIKPVWKLITASGNAIKATANHPFLTGDGWKKLATLVVGDQIAVPYRLIAHGVEHSERTEQCRLLGYLMGNGSVQHGRSLGLILPDDECYQDAVGIIERAWPEVSIRRKSGTYNDCALTRVYDHGWGRPFGNPMREWIRGLGLIGLRDFTKRVPEYVMASGKVGAREFLAGYFATDGCVTRSDHRWSVQFDTTSLNLALGTRHLLAKLGIPSFIRSHQSAKSHHDLHRVSIPSFREHLLRFAHVVPVRGRKRHILFDMCNSLPPRKTRYDAMVLPRAAMIYAAKITGMRDQGKRLGRQTCWKLALKTNDPILRMWANSDLLWERITSIEPTGREKVFDLRIEGNHSFIANGIAVHNSGDFEQDADLALLLWRPDYGTPESPQREIEIIIAKNRDGPVGKLTMYWDPRYTRIEDREAG